MTHNIKYISLPILRICDKIENKQIFVQFVLLYEYFGGVIRVLINIMAIYYNQISKFKQFKNLFLLFIYCHIFLSSIILQHKQIQIERRKTDRINLQSREYASKQLNNPNICYESCEIKSWMVLIIWSKVWANMKRFSTLKRLLASRTPNTSQKLPTYVRTRYHGWRTKSNNIAGSMVGMEYMTLTRVSKHWEGKNEFMNNYGASLKQRKWL